MKQLTEEELSWLRDLRDRKAVEDLLKHFFATLDDRDWEGNEAIYTEDAVLELPWEVIEGRAAIAKMTREGMSEYAATLHYSGDYAVEVEGDVARSRSSLHSVHVFDAAEETRHADVGGWYHCEFRRADQTWKLARVRIGVTWKSGASLTHAD